MEVKNKITRTIGQAKLTCIKHSPEILLAAGIISGGVALVCAVRETLKAEEVLDRHAQKMDEIRGALDLVETSEEPIDYTEEDAKKDKVKTYIQTGWAFAKLYAPTVIFAGLSLTCILTSHGIMRKRNLALAASLATVRKAYDDYRGRVVRDLGSEMDNHFLYDDVEKVIDKEVTDEKGKTKTVKEKYKTPTATNAYSRFFDESNPNWDKDGASNYRFVRAQMIYLQGKLKSNKYLFLNDVYKTLGLPITVAGQSAGWIYDFDDAANTLIGFEGFGVNEVDNSPTIRAFMNGYERNCLLNFTNIRDNILTDIRRIDSSIDAI